MPQMLIDGQKLELILNVSDAETMLQEAARDPRAYQEEIKIIYEKMPSFDYTSFCFYAYGSWRLFEFMLGMSPREYTSFSLNAPDAFFYTIGARN